MSALYVGCMVHYYTHSIGPYAAVVTAVNDNGSVSLSVYRPSGGSFPAFGVTEQPTTPVQHYWRLIP